MESWPYAYRVSSLSDLESQRVPRSEDVAVRVGQRIFHAWKLVLMSPERKALSLAKDPVQNKRIEGAIAKLK